MKRAMIDDERFHHWEQKGGDDLAETNISETRSADEGVELG